MSTEFVHSVKVPRLYKVTARIVRSVREERSSLKNLIYGKKKHPVSKRDVATKIILGRLSARFNSVYIC